MQARIDIAVPAGARAAQAPTWDTATCTLLWVDRAAHLVHRYFPARAADHSMPVPQPVSAAKPRERGGLLLHLDGGIALFESDERRRTWLVYWARDGFRGASTAVDGTGALWAATERADGGGGGWLVRVTPDGRTTTVLRDLVSPSGIAWNPDRTRMYLADSAAGRIDVLDLDETGRPATRRPLCTTNGRPAAPAVDAAGDLWVPMSDRGELHGYTAEGRHTATIPLPAARPTGCCFGGQDLTDLYVTTAREGIGEPAGADGALLVLRDLTTGARTTSFGG
ncbi:SMP-30/gluconolactonase/LRE family protein [Saccharopolyspora sp. HNM0983]|uniref:SMP-30/gluconolactonase/LRE family protein n=1 Tax=Saccharopolyspora montiporae TaxID=2781240 RepID=A0A929BDJ4_9PSEU|nr:SMP-30/gluconolactonase/LRE family protein [Saccharopolyspora sp. HNM0983]MBE9376076.1 SMP-30/gluconolactonase/LRE family protein [Saccharopolyspora sp. HNM0983]